MTENSSFTFWSNMKETLDRYDRFPDKKLKMYDALVEYGLYGVWPEDDGTIESADLISFIQGMVPTLDKSRNFSGKCAEAGSAGGRKLKLTDEQLREAIKIAAEKVNKVPSREEVVKVLQEEFDINVCVKTLSRRISDEDKKKIAEGTLGQNRDIKNVPGTSGQNEMSQGQNEMSLNSSRQINNFNF